MTYPKSGVLAQLARASRWQREGHGFKSHILHHDISATQLSGFFVPFFWVIFTSKRISYRPSDPLEMSQIL